MALDFPSNPTNGQVYDNFIYDSAKGTWKSLSSGASPSILVNPTITNAVISATATNSATVPLVVNGATSQSANLQEWKNNAGIILASISSSGLITAPTANIQTVDLKRNDSSFEGGELRFSRASDNATAWVIDTFGSGTTPALRIFDGTGTVRFSIDNSGRVNTPSQPSFTVTRNDDGNNRAVGDYVFDKVWHNVGGHYSSANGRFTAPVAGRYLFITQMQMWGTAVGTLANVYFRKNGTQYPSATSSEGVNGIFNKVADSGYHANVAVTSVIDLAANDYVTVYQSGLRGMQSHFSGHLLG